MVIMMHYAATCVIEVHGPEDVRRAIGGGRHLSTLALSEFGSRSHFWAPMSTAAGANGKVQLDARKSWVTSAGEADSYVWSSRPRTADGAMTLWLVPRAAEGLTWGPPFDGLGLRGNASTPMTAERLVVPASAQLGEDGAGLDIALQVVLPWFLLLNAAASLGMMEAVTEEASGHLHSTRLEHRNRTLGDEPTARAEDIPVEGFVALARAFIADAP
jgi:isovaleryl-CoA dehydrogenase